MKNILTTLDLKNMGRVDEAWEVLNRVVEQDLRGIDAHVHMGNFKFGYKHRLFGG
jgi:hypothetical protein